MHGNESPREALSTWSMEREIVLSRVINAKRELVFAAWADPQHLPQWFGPQGFTITTWEIDVRVGGRWRYEMRGPDGTTWASRMTFRRIDAPSLIAFDHGKDQDDDAGMFRTTVTFDQQSNGKTVVTLRQLHPTKAQRDAGIGFGAVEFGYQTLDKLARHVV